MIYLYLFGTCFHFIYVFMIIGNIIYFSIEGKDNYPRKYNPVDRKGDGCRHIRL